MDSNVSQAQPVLWNMTFGYLKTMSLRCALSLGIPDAIDKTSRPMTLDQLHSALALPPSKKPQLRRLMRTLTHYGLFTDQKRGTDDESAEVMDDLTAQSRLLVRKNESTNMLPFVRCHVDDLWVKPSLYMVDWFVKDSDRIPAELVHGCNFWEMASVDPEVNKMFNEAMGVESLVDVGGGSGAMARIIAENFPHVNCTVFDLPHVVVEAPNDGIVKFVSGDMFNFVPPANAVLLKWILHDWSNENCIKILWRCRDAIPSREAGGKVIVLEAILGSITSPVISDEPQLLFDMLMLTITEREERDENVLRKLFMDAGFSSYRIAHTVGFLSVIEIYP